MQFIVIEPLPELAVCHLVQGFIHLFIPGQDDFGLLGQDGPAAIFAADIAADEGKAPDFFSIAHDRPGFGIRHGHIPGCALQGTMTADAIQQFGHTRTEGPLIAHEAQRHLTVQFPFCHGHTSFKRYSRLQITNLLSSLYMKVC